jgi:hypothetical protein
VADQSSVQAQVGNSVPGESALDGNDRRERWRHRELLSHVPYRLSVIQPPIKIGFPTPDTGDKMF